MIEGRHERPSFFGGLMAYLTVEQFQALAVCPSSYVDQIESEQPGWTLTQLNFWSSFIDSRLAKRYATPFDADSPPLVVQGWLTRLVTERVYLRRGVDSVDAQIISIQEDAKNAQAEIKEAADSKDGLFELPVRADAPGGDGVSRGKVLTYSEQSPYTWTFVQEENGRCERYR
jgi:hypothetical protein